MVELSKYEDKLKGGYKKGEKSREKGGNIQMIGQTEKSRWMWR